MRISYWSSDVCSSDLLPDFAFRATLCLGVSEISIYDSYISETREMDVRWIATISALALTAAMPAEAREVQALADGWSFAFGIAAEMHARPGFDDSDRAKVAVPTPLDRHGNPCTTHATTTKPTRRHARTPPHHPRTP